MTNNELVLLDQVLKKRGEDRETPIPDDRAFEIFACEQVLRDMDVSIDDVEDGVVGGGKDGGLDGIYAFLGDSLLTEDDEVFEDEFNPSKTGQGTRLVLWLVQAKREESFSETAIDKVASSTSRLLDLSIERPDLLSLYSEAVVDRVYLFRKTLERLATRHPKVEVIFSYVSRGSTVGIDEKVRHKSGDLEAQFAGVMSDAVGRVEFLGATELWRRASSLPSYTLELTYQENATSGTSHVALVTLRDYLAFLRDTDTAELRRHIFDWNVRDYEGSVEVNREIAESLGTEDAPEFWWLNNGITVICSRTSIVGKTYSLDDVQIVNGLQSSHTIYHALGELDSEHPAFDRSVLVRILVTDDQATRDRVIRATNRQTAVPPASLRATDEIQRSIEAYFFANGWFYDRRKNYYRNLGKNIDRIIGIPLLAQAVMAVGLSEPDNSRARPSSLLKRDEDYKRIFSAKIDLAVYLWSAKTQREIDSFLLSEDAETSAPERTNLRFHLAMLATATLFGARVHAPAQLTKVAQAGTSVKSTNLRSLLDQLRGYYSEYAEASGDAPDKIAKGSEFVDFILGSAFPQPSS